MADPIEQEEHEKRAKAFVAKYEDLILKAITTQDSSVVFKLRNDLIYDLRILLREEHNFGSEAQYERLQRLLADVVKKY